MTQLQGYKELIDHIQSNQSIMLAKLHEWCNVNSGTYHLKGLAQMAELITKVYEPIADSIEAKTLPAVTNFTIEGNEKIEHYGNALLIRKRPHLTNRVLLCGHMDTVYPVNSPFQHLKYLNDNCINGPGVSDMKGGLIVMQQALAAFEQLPIASQLGWDVFINADEEVGSLASKILLDELAPQYSAALVYEPAMTAEGTLAKNRRGSGKFTLIAQGKAAHVGRAFNEGRNAICLLAEAITAIHALNGQRDGVTINVGKIAGGEALNVVPALAGLQLDVRITIPEDQAWIRDQLNAIIQTLQRSGYTLSLQGHFGRPVKRVLPNTERLFQRIQKIGSDLGLSINWQDSGGCCDGNNLAQHGLAVIDTLGVRGGNIHSHEEYILIDSLVERASLSALLLADFAYYGFKDIKI